MKKIVPFNNVLEFNTDVKEITAISLEHEINKYPDMINGVFYISGEYKIAEGLLDREKFNFELPFDIALSNNYRTDSLLVDIDDFRYDLISDKSLKVNIDLYIDGEQEEQLLVENDFEELDFLDRDEIIEEQFEESEKREYLEDVEPENSLELINDLELSKTNIDFEEEIEDVCEKKEDMYKEEDECEEVIEEKLNEIEPERIDLLKEMLTNNKEEEMKEEANTNENTNINIFEPSTEENYVTYRVYKVEESDTIDTILTKYNVNKDMLADYNNIENIKPGDKLIIPTNEK